MYEFCPHCGAETGFDEETIKLHDGTCFNCRKNIFEKPKCKFAFKKQKTPFVVNYYASENNSKDLMYSYTITKVTHTEDPVDGFFISVEGEKTFEAPNVKDFNYNSFIEWRMQDPDGDIIKGHWDARNVKVGESFSFSVEPALFSDGGVIKFKIVSKAPRGINE